MQEAGQGSNYPGLPTDGGVRPFVNLEIPPHLGEGEVRPRREEGCGTGEQQWNREDRNDCFLEIPNVQKMQTIVFHKDNPPTAPAHVDKLGDARKTEEITRKAYQERARGIDTQYVWVFRQDPSTTGPAS